MRQRDRQLDALGLRQDRAEEVAGVVVEREDRGGRLADPLALRRTRGRTRWRGRRARPAAPRRPRAPAPRGPRRSARGCRGPAARARSSCPSGPRRRSRCRRRARARATSPGSTRARSWARRSRRSGRRAGSARRRAGSIISSPRMMLTTFESFGSVGLAQRPPDHGVVGGLPRARRTRRSGPGRRRRRRSGARRGCRCRPEIAFAVSSSEETMKSTSISRSRQASRYSTLVVRTTTIARLSFLTSIARRGSPPRARSRR